MKADWVGWKVSLESWTEAALSTYVASQDHNRATFDANLRIPGRAAPAVARMQ